ncbi:hydrogenase [Streptomyces lunaelactis]|uniref:proton-conducting transporter transmembrane domain-containing protein n=1 Tax=Streptomyces lunaelactis TaxID=1535768 RepID=UPI001585AEEE|nr:proton-conducting transporter membrane subunit [Streptomyces lunaelactis]NUK12850.1 hydrogenase [Streptomyces lunaelactis]NUK55462.1 hydrogenase [Streptomyces lunaelactis]NUK60673.1 hydrogenase [Streptomyces lunaelactis]NUK66189.1 hydrogenase [Streptomyces lunaelactis]NUK75104.1 hydrogenase [Streptomyces lunaelactis]
MTSLSTVVLLTTPVAVPLAAAGGYMLTSLSQAAADVRESARSPVRQPALVGATGGRVDGAAAAPPPGADGPRRADWFGLVSPLAVIACGAVLAGVLGDDEAVTAYGGLLRADALTVWMLLVVGAVALIACATSPSYLAGERAAGRTNGRATALFHTLVQAFLAAMCLAVLTANLGVLWVAVEATTIVTAFLVGHRRTRTSVEAAWKYVVICSAGIALAFLGTVLIYYAARQAGISEASALNWPTLVDRAGQLDPDVTRLGITLVILGFGAKAGLVPLHAWLPDAHSQAPAPVSALMSGVLLSVAFTAILRYQVIADAALGTGYTRTLLTGIALLTLALAAALLLAQRDYKRMLAYSSMEHMSLIALGAAIGSPLARTALLLHVAGHGLAKAVAFCASGHVLHLTRTTRIGRVRGLLARAPGPGGTFALAVIALLAFPPFSLFASELGIVRAGFAARMGWAAAVALVLVLIAFAALAARTARMLLGPGPAARTDESPATSLWPLVLGLVACAALGIATGPLTDLLQDAAQAIGAR